MTGNDVSKSKVKLPCVYVLATWQVQSLLIRWLVIRCPVIRWLVIRWLVIRWLVIRWRLGRRASAASLF